MTEATKDLLKRALELPAVERENLARELLASLEKGEEAAEVDPAFVAELRRRVDRALSGTSDPGDEYPVVLERLRKRHEERHRARA